MALDDTKVSIYQRFRFKAALSLLVIQYNFFDTENELSKYY